MQIRKKFHRIYSLWNNLTKYLNNLCPIKNLSMHAIFWTNISSKKGISILIIWEISIKLDETSLQISKNHWFKHWFLVIFIDKWLFDFLLTFQTLPNCTSFNCTTPKFRSQACAIKQNLLYRNSLIIESCNSYDIVFKVEVNWFESFQSFVECFWCKFFD